MSSGSIVGPNGKKYQPESLCMLKCMAERKVHLGYFCGSEGKYPFRFSTLSMNHQRELEKVMVGNITNVQSKWLSLEGYIKFVGHFQSAWPPHANIVWNTWNMKNIFFEQRLEGFSFDLISGIIFLRQEAWVIVIGAIKKSSFIFEKSQTAKIRFWKSIFAKPFLKLSKRTVTVLL